ncbi:MAG: DNA topoisomerase III [Lachnospirales bacterium]
MSKILIIAEKPSVARDIGKVLGCSRKGDGFIHNDEYVISWAVGHLVTLCEPEDYDKKYSKWNKDTLPIIPKKMELKAVTNTRKQLVVLHKLIKDENIKSLICATDSGREGELIFRYIYEITKCTKPFKRLWISSMTDEAIKKGFDTLKEGTTYDNLYYSAKCRSEADWLVGMNATRAFTLQHNVLLSVGRVQTPTLAIIVERHLEILNFVSEPYYELNGTFTSKENSENFIGKWYNEKEKSHKIAKEEDCMALIEKLKGKIGTVKSIKNTKKNTKAPLLFDLTELQRECNSKFAFSAKKTLDIAQSLYESKKVITYPRTDSRYLSNDMKSTILPLIKNLDKNDKFSKYTSYLLNSKIEYTKRIFDDKKITDHHAIIPTGKLNSSLTLDELKVFYTIVKRFLSVFYPDYVYNSTVIECTVEDEIFLTKGQTVISLGWRELYTDEKDKDKDNQVLPTVKKGDTLILSELTKEDKKTTPPAKYNEASLLGAMENPTKFVEDEDLREQLKENGIGTPATRAAIIERLIQVGYIVRNGKILEPTEKGIKLIEVCPDELKSPSTTGKWERGLNKISKGEMLPEKFMESIYRYVTYLVTTTSSHKEVNFPEENYKSKKSSNSSKKIGNCPICENGSILENSKSFFCSNWKNKCKFSIWKNQLKMYNKDIDSKTVEDLLKNGIVKDFELTMPDTKEKAFCELVLNEQKILELKNINVVSNFK